MQSSVSIVIPVYNPGHFLQETLQSIEAARTPSLREVIIVDDGSTDPITLELLKDLEKSQYLVMRQPNRGVGAARNAGIRVAQGDFILPVDDDNRIRRPYLAEGPTLLDRDQSVGVVYGDAEYFGERTGRWRVPQFDLVRLVDANFIDACALFRKRVWEDLGGYDEHMPHMGWEDWDFWLRAAIRGWRFVHLQEVTFDYRVRAGSMLTEVNKHKTVMDSYLFSKKELVALGEMRAELHRLLMVEQTMEYRLGRGLLKPVRATMTMLGGSRTRAKEHPVRSRSTTPTVQK
jgi:glycosyltransferase involved in cell wall biosynthesis